MPTTMNDDSQDFTVGEAPASTFDIPDFSITRKNREARRKAANAQLAKASQSRPSGEMVGPYWIGHGARNAMENFANSLQGALATRALDAEEQSEAKQLADVRRELLQRMNPQQRQQAEAKLAGLDYTPENPAEPKSPIVQTDADGNVLLYDHQGNEIRNLGKVGKPGADGTHAGTVVTDDKGFSRLINTRDGTIIKELGQVGKSLQPPSYSFMPTEGGIVGMNPKNPSAPPINTGLQPPPSAATVQGRREAQSGINAIDAAEAAVDANPDAFGLVKGAAGATDIGGSILNAMSTPDEITARAHIADIGSKKIHDRSGAAVTISETPRLKPFIPSAADSPKAIKAKLKQLRQRMADDGYTFGMPAGSLDKPQQSGRVRVNSKAEFAALPKGTKWETPDGKRGTK